MKSVHQLSERKDPNMDVLEKIRESAIVPVVVLEDGQSAVPTAQALLKGSAGTPRKGWEWCYRI